MQYSNTARRQLRLDAQSKPWKYCFDCNFTIHTVGYTANKLNLKDSISRLESQSFNIL